MFEYYVSAPCAKSVGDVLGPYSAILTPAQARRRARESFTRLKSALSRVPSTVAVSDRPEEGAAFVTTAVDVSVILEELGLYAVMLGPYRRFLPGATHLFYIRAIFYKSPQMKNPRRYLSRIQGRVTRVMREELGGEPGRDPYTYFFADDPAMRWLPKSNQKGEARILQMRKIETALAKAHIFAEIGIRRIPESFRS